jgi:hypothetical protein
MVNRLSRHGQRLRSRARLWGRTVPLRDLTRSPNNLSWASMNDEHAAARTDTPGEFESGPTLTPVRRRGESRLLALMLAAAVVLVAIAVAKPWGEGAPPPGASAATTSLSAEIAKSSTESAPPPLVTETAQAGRIVVQPGDSPATWTLVCTEDPRGGMVCTPEDSPATVSVVCTSDPRGGWVCMSANLQGLESVLPSPSAP